mmetsp:Transcript_32712/g.79581  ORF Transcript_32712/g.79581 Transcript_32712/m.79581 type:complete len:220 (-) Transcript_32712:3-662(-)
MATHMRKTSKIVASNVMRSRSSLNVPLSGNEDEFRLEFFTSKEAAGRLELFSSFLRILNTPPSLSSERPKNRFAINDAIILRAYRRSLEPSAPFANIFVTHCIIAMSSLPIFSASGRLSPLKRPPSRDTKRQWSSPRCIAEDMLPILRRANIFALRLALHSLSLSFPRFSTALRLFRSARRWLSVLLSASDSCASQPPHTAFWSSSRTFEKSLSSGAAS